jgi:hypothetical protein
MTTPFDLPETISRRIIDRNEKIMDRARILVQRSEQVLENATRELDAARRLLEPLGLTVDSTILDPSFSSTDITVLKTTGGYSNTDHIIKITGDPKKDRIAEFKRAYVRRVRTVQPEARGEDRWDKPKIPGERRRRIHREKDLPQAPPEPPPSGYIVFVGQMTCKLRHDRPHVPHSQTKVIQEISRIWKYGMSEIDREYYVEFAREAREEYQGFHQEYRATGRYEPSKKFERIQGTGPWVRIPVHEKNGLERELATYDTVEFPPRPPEFDDAYEQRQLESAKRRRRKEKADAAENKKTPASSDKVSAPSTTLMEEHRLHSISI